MGRKHCENRRNCSLRAVSPFPTAFSEDFYHRHVKTGLVWERVKIIVTLSLTSPKKVRKSTLNRPNMSTFEKKNLQVHRSIQWCILSSKHLFELVDVYEPLPCKKKLSIHLKVLTHVNMRNPRKTSSSVVLSLSTWIIIHRDLIAFRQNGL